MSMLSANDRFEILDLCYRYNNALDHGNEEALMDCWSKGALSFESPYGKFNNWDKLHQFFAKELHGGSLSGKRQILFNVVVREGDDIDTAFIDAEYLILDMNHLELVASGSFKNDKVRRISMGWKFVSRTQKADLLAPSPKAEDRSVQESTHH